MMSQSKKLEKKQVIFGRIKFQRTTIVKKVFRNESAKAGGFFLLINCEDKSGKFNIYVNDPSWVDECWGHWNSTSSVKQARNNVASWIENLGQIGQLLTKDGGINLLPDDEDLDQPGLSGSEREFIEADTTFSW